MTEPERAWFAHVCVDVVFDDDTTPTPYGANVVVLAADEQAARTAALRMKGFESFPTPPYVASIEEVPRNDFLVRMMLGETGEEEVEEWWEGNSLGDGEEDLP